MGMGEATNVVHALARGGLFRVRDLKREGISPNWMPFFEWRNGFPHAVFWGPSALWLLGELDREPVALWVAIGNKSRPPRTLDPSTVIVRTRRLNDDVICVRPGSRPVALRVHHHERARADLQGLRNPHP